MGTIWVKEFIGGLDARRVFEATSGGVLVRARNGHITRGGEFDQRAAFIPAYTLPAGTIGMHYTPSGLVVFGSNATPSGMPISVSYQRLQHPSGYGMVRVLSTELYAGKIYAVAEFSDGSIHHFYDGVRVTDWFDGRARATFVVSGGVNDPAVRAVGSFEVTGGTLDAGNSVSAIAIDGVNILGVPIDHTGTNSGTAAVIAAQINSYISSPDYTAVASGQTVTITAATGGTAPNGKTIVPTVAGDVTIGNIANMAGGMAAVQSAVTDIKVNGISVINTPIYWDVSNNATAAAIIAAINGFSSVPDYVATGANAFVNLIAATPGASPNGYSVTFTLTNGFTVTPNPATMANGAASPTAYQPGDFVKTVGSKMYSVAGPNVHFSGIKAPTEWTTGTVGAGFIDLSTETAGAEQLIALARYQTFVAIFAERVIQIWYMDPDPSLNRRSQVLENTGTTAPRSVTAFGDTDVFYLDQSGLRSMRARDSSNAAATTDIGNPVDDIIVAKLASLTDNERRQVIGLIEPRDGRFWLIMKDQIFVFSFFTGAKVSAWTTYDTTYESSGEQVPFDVDAAVVFNRRVYLRAGNTIFVYGGLGTDLTYDAVEAEAWLPYLDGNDPTRIKNFNGVDLAMRGLWRVAAAMDPVNMDVEEPLGVFDSTTYNRDSNPLHHHASHISLRFRSQGQGPHRLAACVIHYEGDADED